MSSTSSTLLVHPDLTKREYITVTPQSAGWEHLHFKAIRLNSFDSETKSWRKVCS